MRCHRIASLSQAITLASVLPACSNPPQSHQTLTGTVTPQVEHLEECSTLGIMACRVVSLLSGDAAAERRSTCIASRGSNGTRTEKCGSVEAKAPLVGTGRNVLTWSDNSNNETNFVIERCDQISLTVKDNNRTVSCAGGWRPIGNVEANVTSYTDNTALVNRTYIYRVKATNSMGSSGYTSEVAITTPSR
jgi:hypothetical protein